MKEKTAPTTAWILFMYECYYPRGGWADLVDVYGSYDEALAEARRRAALVLRDYDTLNYPGDHVEHADYWQIVRFADGAGKLVGFGSLEQGRNEKTRWEEDLDPNQLGWWEEF